MNENRRKFVEILEGVLGKYGLTPFMALALRFFLRNPYENLVIVNRKGRLEFLDRGSEKSFGLGDGGAKGMEVTELIPDTDLPRVLETGVPHIGRVFNVNGTRRIGSTYPLLKDGEMIGAIGRIIFRSLDELERVNSEVRQLKTQVRVLRDTQKQQNTAHYTFDNILGISASIREAVEMARKVAHTDSDVLVTGESGTGKEIFAQAIHNAVNPQRPFVQVNSSTIPFELAESELFGYVKGSFTGATASGKPGKFELAHNGTFFLDEIGSLPLSIQAKLLRVFQEREIGRLGDTKVQKINFRLIGATNADLRVLVKEGKFREDLYFRIAKANISIPALRERRDDIPVYVNHFLKKINQHFGTHFKRLSSEALVAFIHYEWPGNIRELINVLEQACLKQWEGDEIPMTGLPHELVGRSTSAPSRANAGLLPSKLFKKELADKGLKLILDALENTKRNKRKAALLLGMPRSTLYKKLKDYGVSV